MFLINFSSANQIELIGNSDNIIQINDDFLLNLKVKLPDNISKNDFNFYLLIKKDGKLLDKIDNLNIILNKDNLISLDYSFDKKGIYIIEWNLENSKEKYKFEEIIVMFDNISLINELDLEKLNNYIEKNEFFQDFDESDIFLIDNLLSEISNTNYKENYNLPEYNNNNSITKIENDLTGGFNLNLSDFSSNSLYAFFAIALVLCAFVVFDFNKVKKSNNNDNLNTNRSKFGLKSYLNHKKELYKRNHKSEIFNKSKKVKSLIDKHKKFIHKMSYNDINDDD